MNFGVTEAAKLFEHEAFILPGGTYISAGLGWTAPFIQGRNSTQSEICGALVDIFNRSGRVVLDAIVPGNFITRETSTGSETICIDVGMSLMLQEQQENERRHSADSLMVWRAKATSSYLPWFKQYESSRKYSDVVQMTKALFTLQQKFPFITNADFLKKEENKDIRMALAKELDNTSKKIAIKEPILKKLKQIQEEEARKSNPEMIVHIAIETEYLSKQSTSITLPVDAQQVYITKLNQYINSRGSLDTTGTFSPSTITSLFRDVELTRKKVQAAVNLRDTIQKASSLNEIQLEVDRLLQPTDNDLLASSRFFTSGLRSTLESLSTLIDQAIPKNEDNSYSPVER